MLKTWIFLWSLAPSCYCGAVIDLAHSKIRARLATVTEEIDREHYESERTEPGITLAARESGAIVFTSRACSLSAPRPLPIRLLHRRD